MCVRARACDVFAIDLTLTGCQMRNTEKYEDKPKLDIVVSVNDLSVSPVFCICETLP